MGRHIGMAAIAAVLISGPALASGYGLKEFSATAMGAAYAGAAASSADPTFLAYNPASLAGVGQGDAAISVIGILPDSDAHYSAATTTFGNATGGTMTPRSFIGSTAIPQIAVRERLSTRWAAGLSVTVPWGLSTSYPEGWAGRYYALTTKLMTVNATPVLSYQVSPTVALAGGIQFQYAKGTLSSAVDIGTIGASYSVSGSVPGGQDGAALFKGDDWGYGFVAGVMVKPSDALTLGLAYRSAINHTMSGPLTFRLDTAGVGAVIKGATGLFADSHGSADLTTPDTVNAGARLALSDHWTGLVEVDWTNWSRFHELRIVADNPAQPDDVTAANWKDSWFFSLGAEYRPNTTWTFRFGSAYDQSPIPDVTRGPRIPDANRFWLAAGASYRLDDNVSMSVSAGHLFNGDSSINLTTAGNGNALRGNLSGTTSSGVTVIGWQCAFTL